jgi:SAM-dependent methyltransferase
VSRRSPSHELNPALVALTGRPRSVLDVGAGAGVHGMVARRTGAYAVGIERNPDPARLLLDEVVAVDPADLARVEAVLGERRFELVLMHDLADRADDPARLIEFYARYVEDEGRLIVSAFNREAWPVKLHLDASDIGYVTSSGDRPRLFTRGEAETWLRTAGLEVLAVEHNPMLLKALRGALGDDFSLSVRHGEEQATGFRDSAAYELYRAWVRPLELAITGVAPSRLAFQNVVVGRRRPRARRLGLTVGMLTMDEEPSVARMIEEIRVHAPDAEILCVDSSVKDRTPLIAQELGARVLRQLPPQGHGPAMELLMYEAAKQSEALVYLDCDFTYPPADIPRLRAILESGVDVVNASRIRERPAAMPLPNYWANKAFVACARALNGMPLTDLHSGMRGYRTSVIRAFSFDGSGDALPIDTLLWPARRGYRVVEIPIDYQERIGLSKLRKVAGTVWTFVRLARTLGVGSRRGDTYEQWTEPPVEAAERKT